MKKLLIAGVVASMSLTAVADVSLIGKWKSTITNDNGPSTLVNDLDLTLKGKVNNDTMITTTFENIGKTDSNTVEVKQMYIQTSIEGLDAKIGKSKGQDGKGLLQDVSAVSNKITLSTNVGGINVSATQKSGDGNATADISGEFGGVFLSAENVLNSNRFLTGSLSVGNIDILAERQKTTVGTNTGIQLSTTMVGGALTGVYIDVEDTIGVTHDGILENISDANNGSTVKGAVVSLPTLLGDVTGKYIVKNDLSTVRAELNRGNMTYIYSKTENTDSVLKAELSVTF